MPADYNELTGTGQKDARVWRVKARSTPREDVLSWNFFRSFYLQGATVPFYKYWVEPAPGHYDWVWAAAQYPRLLMTAHRGSAKSTIMSKELPLRDLVSVPGRSNFVILSNDKAIARHARDLMIQLDTNQRITDDFGVLKPKRTEGSWNHHELMLTNYATLTMGSVNSMMLRGLRPDVITLDDVERDPKLGTNIAALIEQTDLFFFQVVLPMARAHTKIRFCGTPNNKQTLIYRLQHGDDSRVANEARFHNEQYWFYNKDGSVFWPGEYPTPESIAVKKEELGDDVWAFEMLGEDTMGENAILHVDPVKNEYTIEDIAGFNVNDPLVCESVVRWSDSVPCPGKAPMLVPRTAIFKEFLSHMHRFITVDYASSLKKTADWSVIHVFGADRLNQIFSLDLWAGRVQPDTLISKIWEMARNWKVRVVGVESVAAQANFYGRVAQWRDLVAQGDWLPQPVPIGSYKMSKPERILATRWRFTDGAFKLPAWRAKDQHYRELYYQIAGFSPNTLLGTTGLSHDDHLDTVAMAQELIGGRRGPTIGREPTGDIFEQIRRGVKEIIPGIPIGTMMPLHMMPMDIVNKLMQRPQPESSKIVWESGSL